MHGFQWKGCLIRLLVKKDESNESLVLKKIMNNKRTKVKTLLSKKILMYVVPLVRKFKLQHFFYKKCPTEVCEASEQIALRLLSLVEICKGKSNKNLKIKYYVKQNFRT
jgi:hypothetical protein